MRVESYALGEYHEARRAFAECRPLPGETEGHWGRRLELARLRWLLASDDLEEIVRQVGEVEGHGVIARIGPDDHLAVVRLRDPSRHKEVRRVG